MSRPIIMTDEMRQKALTDFTQLLENTKMSDGKLSYNRSFKYDDRDATVWLTMEAYRKIVALVIGFDDEVGWHGTVSRLGDDEFVIENIFVYPQEVTGSTVTTDQEIYTKWLYELDDETFKNLRMHGHSHVEMGVSPSGVDDKHRQQILNQLESEMLYIFQIWNKSLTVHTIVYDMSRNILYEDKDVTVKILGDDDMDEFLENAHEMVQKRTSNNKKYHAERKDFGYDYHEMYDQYDLSGRAWRC